jgi:putative membrane protein
MPTVTWVHQEPWWGVAWHVLPILLLAILTGVVVWAVVRGGPRWAASPAAPATAIPRPDPALEELRIRYARGEVDPDDYRRRVADLGGPPMPAPSPGEEPGADPPTTT